MSASGELTAVRYVSESSFGVPSGSTYKALRFTGTSLNLKKGVFQTNEIRADRQKSDLRHGLRQVGGDVNIELGLTTFNDLLEAAFSGTWAAVTTGSQTLAAASGSNTFTRASGSFITDGFLPGDEITVAGFATGGNNGRTKVTVVAALSLTVEKTLVTDVAAAARTIQVVGQRVKSSTSLKTFSIERAFTDVNQYLLFKGCAVDQFKLSVKPDTMVTGAFSFLGKDVTVAGVTNASGVTAPATNSPFDAFTGTIQEAGAAIATITALDLTISNGRSVKGIIGQNSPQEIYEGQFDASGTVSAFFSTGALLNKFLAETESSLDLVLKDINGTDFHHLRLPRIKYTGGDLDNPQTGPVTLSLPFTALLDATAGAALIYQRSDP